MGMYTTVSLKIKLKSSTPASIINFLKKTIVDGDIGLPESTVMFTSKDVVKPAFEHQFFKCDRWYMLFISTNGEDLEGGRLVKHKDECLFTILLDTEFKNYDSEVDEFLDWIKPYIRSRKKKQYLGWSKHESAEDRRYFHLINNEII